MTKKNQKPNLKKIVDERRLEFHHMFNQEIDEINGMLKSGVEFYLINNKLVDIRNRCANFINNALTEIVAAAKHQVTIKVSNKRVINYAKREFQKPCEICDEKRISNFCHVIPRSEGGDNDAGNMLVLCPTHHFLFDHARLTKAEFEAIDDGKLSESSRDYLHEVHRKRHELKWKYQTNRFAGCKCGLQELKFVPYSSGAYVKIALRCEGCGETWLNLWEELHPFTRAEIMLWDPLENISGAEKSQRRKRALEQIEKFIDEDVPKILNETS